MRAKTAPRHVVQELPATSCLAGGGEMGALMRAFAWERTPLGPVGSWPQSLKTTAGLLLASRFPKMICWGPDFIQLYNDAYRPVLGATKHPAALGQSSRECWPEIWHMIGPMFEQVRASGEAYSSEDHLFVLDRNGYPEETYFTYSYSPIRDETGGVGGVLVTCVETTRRLLGERRLALLGHLSAAGEPATTVEDAAERLFAALVDAAPDIPFALLYLSGEEEGTALLAGATGLPPQLAPPDSLPFAVPLARGPHRWPIHRVRQGAALVVAEIGEAGLPPFAAGPWPEPIRQAVLLPVGAGAGPGAGGVLIAGVSPRRALDDEYVAFVQLVATHTTAVLANVRRQEDQRRRAEELAALDRAKTLFFSDVSHELRTPLTLILSPLEELQAALADAAPEQAELVRLAQGNARRLQKLVNNLLEFSRIEAGRNEPVRLLVDLARLTADVASTFRSAVEQAGLELAVECGPEPVPGLVDAEMWERIVLNLVSNAFKHTFEGTITVRITRAGALARLEICDTGVGIDAAELPHIFDRFHRVRQSRSRTHEGTGIGLSLVRELVHLHGGTVRVESTVGRGTTVQVELQTAPPDATIPPGIPETVTRTNASPLYLDEALGWLPTDPGAGEGLTAAAPEAPDEPALILVVDDNTDMRDYLLHLLRPHWTVEAVADGSVALRFALEYRPDLVIADVMMPGMDGLALVRALRANPSTADVAVMLLSARAGEGTRDEGLAAGADDYVVKPFAAGQLLALVRTRLKRIRARREKALAALRRSEAQLRAVIASAADMIVTLGPDLVITSVNPAFERATGRSAEEVIGRDARELLESVDEPEVAARLEILRRGDELPPREYRARTAAGAELVVEVRSAAIREGDEFRGVVSTLRDVTAQRRMDAELRASRERLRMMSRHLVATIEQERARISRELHDQVGQALLAARTHLQVLDSVPAGTDTRVRQRAVVQALDEAVEVVRGLAYDLRPSMLDELGLVEAVRTYARRQAAAARIRLRVTAAMRGPRVHPDVETTCYRIAQEAVANAVRHARAQTIRIQLRRKAGELLLIVRDDGRGLDTDQAGWARLARRGRLGLLGMTERAALIGGHVEVRSIPDGGTTIIARLPSVPVTEAT